jgi:ligand-binding SRPBCC domain-containing protein
MFGSALHKSRVHDLHRRQLVPRPLEDVFAFFAEAANLERITPPWLAFGLVTPQPVEMGLGTLIEYRLRLHRFPVRWISRIEHWEPGRAFEDVQVTGPYRLWRHRHEFSPARGGTLVHDHVRYALPLGPLGELAHALFVERDLTQIFAFRHAAVDRLLT